MSSSPCLPQIAELDWLVWVTSFLGRYEIM